MHPHNPWLALQTVVLLALVYAAVVIVVFVLPHYLERLGPNRWTPRNRPPPSPLPSCPCAHCTRIREASR